MSYKLTNCEKKVKLVTSKVLLLFIFIPWRKQKKTKQHKKTSDLRDVNWYYLFLLFYSMAETSFHDAFIQFIIFDHRMPWLTNQSQEYESCVIIFILYGKSLLLSPFNTTVCVLFRLEEDMAAQEPSPPSSMENNKPGFPKKILANKLEDKHLCNSCQNILRRPFQAQCGHRFCFYCFNRTVG